MRLPVLRRLASLGRTRGSSAHTKTKPARMGRRARRLGRRGERVARRALRSAGYRILGRNLRTPFGEVDLLALEGDALVVVEVKTTARPGALPHAQGIRAVQRRRLRRASTWLAQRARPPRRVRRDLVIVLLGAGSRSVTIRRGHF